VVAAKITEFLKATDRFAKTIVFCENIDHAERMRQALVNANPDLAAANSKYVMRITGDNDEGKAQLDNFIDPESTYPVIATTSQLMSTGVDAQTCHLIVLDKRIKSMTEFKQIIGRGTRINEDYNKLFFTIMDFKRATALFADPDFDGDPVQIYEPGPGESACPARRAATRRRGITVARTMPPPVGPAATRLGGPASTTSTTSRSASPPSACSISDADGKLITESLKDYTRKTLRKAYASLNAFLNAWNDAERKQAILRNCHQGCFLDELAEQVGATTTPSIWSATSPSTSRRSRAASAPSKVKKRNVFAKYGDQARAVLRGPAPESTPTEASAASSRWRSSRWIRSRLRHAGRDRQALRRQERLSRRHSRTRNRPLSRRPPDPCPTSPTSSNHPGHHAQGRRHLRRRPAARAARLDVLPQDLR
jgi:type I restriction enzyme R subunit